MTSWLSEVLHGVRKQGESGRGVELRSMTISELSGVDDPAHGYRDWLLLKSAEGKTKLSDLSDDQLDMLIADFDRAHLEEPYDDSLASDLAALRAEKTRRQQGGIQKAAADEGPEFPGLKTMSTEELLALQEWCEGDPEAVEKALARQPRGWGRRLVGGQRILFE